ncbi:probable aspartic proteinase GIP2 [Humulus lupulus]|uniref:probable aspartic proteinase GIP2 n=1 Tax=Humulus lupulus TaxID=3486 RepID=UPI002B4041E5|nr:probable aspartic proteinase GIP2 [Humulus lupulus]
MATLLQLVPFLLYLLTLSHAQIDSHFGNSLPLLLLPVTKDSLTNQYLTEIRHGSSLLPTKLVIDLGGPLIWMGCDSYLGSSSPRRISSGSIQCLAAKPITARKRGGDDDGCTLFAENKISQMGRRGVLVADTLDGLLVVEGSQSEEVNLSEYPFLFACAPKPLLNGLAGGANGIVGLGRTRIAFPSQVSAAFSSEWQFTLCLSSSNGVVLYEKGYYSSVFGSEISKSLIYTPLLAGPGDSQHEYFINLKSIRIGGKRLSFDVKHTRLSTIVPFTTMESSIYAIFIKAYEKAAFSMNMKTVEPVAPFGLCFDSKSIKETQLGPLVPDIELGLQSEMVRWNFHGRNLMVKMSDEVMCLGFVDGGLNSGVSIVLGGYQLEDMVLHFDVGTSMLGFSPSLLKWERSCSILKFDSLPVQSL